MTSHNLFGKRIDKHSQTAVEIVIDQYFYGEAQVYQFPIISCINDEKLFLPDMHVLKNIRASS